eukprot:scaffold2553_cov162-Skeletonema_marinoi.AAC.17
MAVVLIARRISRTVLLGRIILQQSAALITQTELPRMERDNTKNTNYVISSDGRNAVMSTTILAAAAHAAAADLVLAVPAAAAAQVAAVSTRMMGLVLK